MYFTLLKDLEIKIQETRQRFKNEFVQGECVIMRSVPLKVPLDINLTLLICYIHLTAQNNHKSGL